MRYTVYFVGLFFATVTRAGAKLCWTGQWFNSTSPEFNGGSDFESQSPAVLSALCPDGGPVAAHCKDEKGEPMTGFKDDLANHYIVNCTVSGFQCHPYQNTAGAKCADFAIEYACNCPTTIPPSTISSGVVTHAPGSAVSSSSTTGAIGNTGSTIVPVGGSGRSTRGSGIGGTTVSGGSSNINASGGGFSGSGSGGGAGGSGSINSSTENAAGENSAFGGSCTCKNGSNKIHIAVVPMLLSVIFQLF